jgi:enediyne biosynthesis protein E4
LQQKNGSFIRSSSQPWQTDNNCDNVQSVFFDVDGDKDLDFYIVSGGNENLNASSYQDRLYINNGRGNFTKAKDALPAMNSSKSCVAVADYNSDGKPDIFVGGRVVPGSYGLSPQSYLLRNETVNGKIKFVDVTSSVAPSLQHAGMITSAVWTDLNKDHLPDLIIAGEWMPVKVFINSKNKLEDKTDAYGLRNSNGLWTCIAPMDIDGDGDEDFLLGNLAPNTQFNASAGQPMTLCVNDYFKINKTEPVLCYYIQGKSYPYASRNEVLEDMPALKKKFFYYKDYAVASFNDIFTHEQQKGMVEFKANELNNCWLENAGGKMILHELPIAAQFSAIQGAVITDINNNGIKEVFAAGNFYSFRVQLGREDAGKGILLQWDAKKHSLIQTNLSLGVCADGDVRDVLSVQNANHDQLIIISKNSDSVQVIKPTVHYSQKKIRS